MNAADADLIAKRLQLDLHVLRLFSFRFAPAQTLYALYVEAELGQRFIRKMLT